MSYPPDKYAHIDLKAAGVNLKDGEPWFLLRGQDVLTPNAMRQYAFRLDREGKEDMAADVRLHADAVQEWQAAHPEWVKLPD